MYMLLGLKKFQIEEIGERKDWETEEEKTDKYWKEEENQKKFIKSGRGRVHKE